MNETPPERLPYDHDKFVDRDKAIDLVVKKALCLAARERVERRVVIFDGQRGSGKTWLALELVRRLNSFITALSVNLKESPDVQGIKNGIPANRPLALVVDEVQEAGEARLDELEALVLAPLIREPDVLLVLMERGRQRWWKLPELRDESDEMPLGPFEEIYVVQQVAGQVPDTQADIADIFAFGRGFPWSTWLLARNLPDPSALEECAKAFLWNVASDLHPYFRALCVLRAFDETRMPALLPAFSSSFQKSWPYQACRKVRECLVDTTLARWDSENRGYVLDEALRTVLLAQLLISNREAWIRLHTEAARLYDGWAQQYPQSSAWWKRESDYHWQCVALASQSPPVCLQYAGM